jgi:osmotically-inducible protein OsmY
MKQASATGDARSLKEALTRRTTRAATGTAAADEEVGSISGAERFLRSRRRRTAFVGRDLNEMTTFVGEIQGSTSGSVSTSVSGRRVRLQRNANLTAQRTNQASRGIYEPPLAIGFAVEPLAPASLETSLGKLLNDSSRIHRVGPLSVTVDDRTATLAGVVASAGDRQLAEAYLRFEPSLSQVVNQLTIQPRPGQQ